MTENLPYPGDELVCRVTGQTDRDLFFVSGKRSVEDIERGLRIVGQEWDSFSRILDFGCGCGRIMLWLEGLARRAELHGVDIDEQAIAWSRENIPFARFEATNPMPPLPYPDGHFDLIFNHSVFTHIDENYQDQWLAELHRLTRPGATLLLSVHGEHAFGKYLDFVRQGGGDSLALSRKYSSEGILFVKDDPWIGGPFPEFFHTTYHSPAYVFEHWGRYFEIKAFLPQGALEFQDLVVLERKTGVPRTGRLYGNSEETSFSKSIKEPAEHHTIVTLREAIRQQGERINRMERELVGKVNDLAAAASDTVAKANVSRAETSALQRLVQELVLRNEAPPVSAWSAAIQRHREHIAMNRGAANASERTLAETDVGRLMLAGHDRVITEILLESKQWEPLESSFINSNLQAGMTFLDVGAHVGYHSIRAARLVGPAGLVIALEPSPENFILLNANLEMNGIRNAVTFPGAAWKTSGTTILKLSTFNTGDNRVVPSAKGSQNAIEVPVVALDDLLPADLKIDMVKVDTQGSDRAAVEGMARTIQRSKPLMVVEFWPDGIRLLGEDPLSDIAFYRQLGYEVRILELPHIGVGSTAEQILQATEGAAGGFVTLVLAPRDAEHVFGGSVPSGDAE